MEDNNDYAYVTYVDTRNAVQHDHRTGGGARPGSGNRIPPGWENSPALRPQRPMVYPQQPQVIYAQGPTAGTFAGGLLAKLTAGQMLEIAAQLFAALQPLPGAPIPTKDASIDSGNMILYQSALASHAKRDEQVRTVAGLIAKLVG